MTLYDSLTDLNSKTIERALVVGDTVVQLLLIVIVLILLGIIREDVKEKNSMAFDGDIKLTKKIEDKSQEAEA